MKPVSAETAAPEHAEHSYESIRVERRKNALVITLDRPDRLNAVSLDMADEISLALSRLSGARAVLITGTGRAFCAGIDLAKRSRNADNDGGEGTFRALTLHLNPLIARMAELPVPIISAVNGPAAGFGCAIALASDFVLAGRSAYFLQAFANIGLIPDGGTSWALPRLIGKARATEMMMLGERMPAEKAEEWGMIYRAVDDAALLDEAFAFVDRLSNGPTVAFGLIKRTIAAAADSSLTDALHSEALGQKAARVTEDAVEGERAFLEKRKPAFKGV